MKFRNLIKAPGFIFLPFLFLYIGLVFLFPSDGTEGDETRYMQYAMNLLNFLHSQDSLIVDLNNGPGYPIILLPFLALKLPLVSISLLNAILHYLSVVILFKALRSFVSMKVSLICSILWALNYNVFPLIPMILTEILTTFLIIAFIFCIIRVFDQTESRRVNLYLLLSGFILAYIILTKTIFFYVLLVLIIVLGFSLIFRSGNINLRKGFIILIISAVSITPYILYTYSVTERLFVVTTKADNLYWMSTPYAGEYGDWFAELVPEQNTCDVINDMLKPGTKGFPGSLSHYSGIPDSINQLKRNHLEDYAEINKLSGMDKNEAYNNLAIENIKSHPVKFVKNCISNIGRLFFNFPYSYTLQRPRTLLRFPYNGIIAMLILLSLVPTYLNWRKIRFSMKFLLLFSGIYFGGSVLLSANTRMLTVIVPIFILWTAYILENSIKFQLHTTAFSERKS